MSMVYTTKIYFFLKYFTINSNILLISDISYSINLLSAFLLRVNMKVLGRQRVDNPKAVETICTSSKLWRYIV